MIEEIASFFSGFFLEKLMQKNVRPYQISLLLVLFTLLLLFTHQAFFQNKAIDSDSLIIAFSVFTPIFFVLWGIIAYFYRQERMKGH